MGKGRLGSRHAANKRWDARWTELVSDEQSRRMSRIRSKDTTPEMRVRSIVHLLGYRFRLHRRDLPGHPDLVFPRLNKVIEVRGCFWHAHSCLKGRRPAVRTEYWHPKLARTVRRDRRNVRKLRAMGWRVLVVWDCQTADEVKLISRLTRFLRQP